MIIRLLTYNILFGGRGREPLILDVLTQNRPDILVLQEVTRTRFVESLAKELGMHVALPSGPFRQRVAILSARPIRNSRAYSLFPTECNVLESEIEYQAGSCLTVFGLHLTASSHLLPMEAVRWWQASCVKRLLRGQLIPIVAGDLNAVGRGDRVDVQRMPRSLRSMLRLQGGRHRSWATPQLQRAGLVDAYRELHPSEAGHTLPARDPHIRLDYIWIPRELRQNVRRCEPVQTPTAVRCASDHLPLCLEIELK